ncbi:DUF2158 domain-containing protein [Mesorhizobium sp. LSHC414A00]|uniref:YodC family protein n=1 Tax=Mesorhizobium sp. LSHC414A00 TaxID=1287287 RepID=UPI0003CE144A|nr:DUF2158 domain-containing protein [Mesorhizobium sp. LSHC414A00]ESX78486.1 hypothetical protein X757_09040 [Mesorhizobium sp. LSHC414A00]
MNAQAFSPYISQPFTYPPTEEVTDGIFDVGDIVVLVSGGPPLTVLSVCECGSVEVAWFDGSSLSIQTLPEEALIHAEPD